MNWIVRLKPMGDIYNKTRLEVVPLSSLTNMWGQTTTGHFWRHCQWRRKQRKHRYLADHTTGELLNCLQVLLVCLVVKLENSSWIRSWGRVQGAGTTVWREQSKLIPMNWVPLWGETAENRIQLRIQAI